MGSHPNQHRAFVSRVKGLSQEELKEHFGAFGSVTDVYFPVDKETGVPKSIAFVTFAVRLRLNATHLIACGQCPQTKRAPLVFVWHAPF